MAELKETDHFVEDVVARPTLLLRRVGPPLLALLMLFVGGGVGYYLLGAYNDRHWTLLDCVWMSVISITTVGYGEVFPLDFPAARIYTMGLLISGMGVGVWAMSSVTAFFVEGHLGLFFRERALEKRIAELADHTIVCGLSPSSAHVIEEHLVAGRGVVLVDARHELAQTVHTRWPSLPVVIGDPSDDDVLRRAAIDRARSVVCCLDTDRDNLFLVISARQQKSTVEIVVECDEQQSVSKFKAAGATHVVNPTFIGGMRIASQVLRPQAVVFLDQMLRGHRRRGQRSRRAHPRQERAQRPRRPAPCRYQTARRVLIRLLPRRRRHLDPRHRPRHHGRARPTRARRSPRPPPLTCPGPVAVGVAVCDLGA